jgi:YD repeat-containing protein
LDDFHINTDGSIMVAGVIAPTPESDNGDGVVATSGTVGLAKYNANGVLINSYGNDGTILTTISALVDGEVDEGNDDTVTPATGSFGFQSDGKIVASLILMSQIGNGSLDLEDSWRLARINPNDGSLDTTFGNSSTGYIDVTSQNLDPGVAINFQPSTSNQATLITSTGIIAIGSTQTFDGLKYDNTGSFDSFYWVPLVVRYSDSAAPAATDLKAEPTADGKVTLSWTNSGYGQRGYEIERSTSQGNIDASSSLLATIGPDQTSFIDSTVSPGTQYYYKVIPFSSATTGGISAGTASDPVPVKTLPTETVVSSSTVQSGYVLQQTISIAADGSLSSASPILQSGVTYLIVASGTMDLGTDSGADAQMWYSTTDSKEYGESSGSTRFGVGFATFDGTTTSSVTALDWGMPDPAHHTYVYGIVGQGLALKFNFNSDVSFVTAGAVPLQIQIYAPVSTGVTPPTTASPVRRLLPLPSAGLGPGTASIINTQTDVRYLSVNPDGAAAPWALWLVSSTGARIALAHGDTSAGYLPNDPAIYSLDPSLCPNGSYTLQLTSSFTDPASTVVDSLPILIASAAKQGNLTFPITDATINTATGPITIARTYDSSRVGLPSDLAPGWSLNLFDTHLFTTAQPDTYAPDLAAWRSSGVPLAFRPGDLIYLTVPDDGQHVFEYDPEPISLLSEASGSQTSQSYMPQFVAIDGSGATLHFNTSDFLSTYNGSDNQLFGTHDGGSPGSVAAMTLPFQLTTKDGTSYFIDDTGLIQYVVNSNGSKTTYNYSAGSITATTGGTTLFTAYRSGGRITSIDVTNAPPVTYNYDGNGNLVSVVNQLNQTTDYTYNSAYNSHYLTSVVNSQGKTVLQAGYDATTGQLASITNGQGFKSHISTVGVGANEALQTTVDAMGNVTQRVIDETYGTLLRTIQQVTAANGSVLYYIVTPTEYTYISQDFGAISALRPSGVTLLQSVVQFPSFEIIGADSSGERFSADPPPNSWTTLTSLGTIDNPQGWGSQTTSLLGSSFWPLTPSLAQPVAVSQRTTSDGDLKTTTFSDFTFAISPDFFFRPLPQKIQTEIQIPIPGSSSNQYGNYLQSVTYNGYTSYGDPSYSVTSLGVADPSSPTHVLAQGTESDYSGRLLLDTHDVIASIAPDGTVSGFNATDTRVSDVYYQASELSTPGSIYLGLKYTIDASGQETYYAYNSIGEPVLKYVYKEWTDQSGTHYGWVGTDTVYNSLGQTTDTYEATYLDPNSNTDGNITANQTLPVTTGGPAGIQVNLSVYSGFNGGARLQTSHTDYNAIGQKIDSIDQYGGKTTYSYDAQGNLIQTAYPDGTVVQSVYDALNRQVWTTNRYSPGNISSLPIISTHTVYNQLGQVVATQTYSGVAITLSPLSLGSSLAFQTSESGGTLVSETDTFYNQQGQAAETYNTITGLKTGTVYYPNGQVQYTGPLVSGLVDDPANASAWYNSLPFQSDGTLSTTTLGNLFITSQSPNVTQAQYTTNVFDQINSTFISTWTSNDFTMPSVGGTVNVDVSSTGGFYVGQYVDVAGAGGFSVQSITTDSHNGDPVLVLLNLGYTFGTGAPNTTPGQDIISGARIDGARIYDGVVDANSNETDTYKDSQGRVIETRYPDGTLSDTAYSIGSTPATLDAYGDSITDPSGWVTIPTGDSETVQIAKRAAGDPIVATYSIFDAAGNLTDVYEPAVLDGNPADSTYNTVVNPRWTYVYDKSDNEITQVSPNEQAGYQASPTSFTGDTQFAYDQFGNEVSRTLPDAESESFTYNEFNQEATHKDFDGNVATYSYYNSYGSGAYTGMLQQVQYVAASGSGKANQTVTYTYTPVGQQQTVNDASGTTTYTYDKFGNMIQSATPEGTINYVFDAATQLHTETWTEANGTNTNKSTATVFTDILYGYDKFGRLASVSQATINGATPSAISGGTLYNADGVSSSTSLPTTLYTYDNVGNLLTEQVIGGDKTTYGYTAMNQLRQESVSLPGNQTFFVDAEGITYYDNGLRSSVRDRELTPSGTLVTDSMTVYSYDNEGRLTGEVVENGTSNEGMANNILPRAITLPPAYGGYTLTWNSSNAYVTSGTTLAHVLANTGSGLQAALIDPDEANSVGFSGSLGNGSDWMLIIDDAAGHADYLTFSQAGFTFTPDGAIENVGNWVSSSNTPAFAPGTLYTYDLDNNRMAKIQTGSSSVTITTDSYNGDDQLETETQILNSSTVYTTTNHYDNNGSLTSSVTGSQHTTYTYDVRNKMVAYNDGTHSATYVYDDAGERVQETANGSTSYYLTDTQNPTGYDQPIEQWAEPIGSRSGQTPSTTYVLGDRVLAQINSTGTISYLLSDGHGSTRALTNASGVITSNSGVIFSYDAFGTALNFAASSAGTVFLFGGDAIYDSISGLYMHGDGVRDRLGFEFIQMDSAAGTSQDPFSLHKYLYTAADPLNGSDPSGRATLVDLDADAAWLGYESAAAAQDAALGGGALAQAAEVADAAEAVELAQSLLADAALKQATGLLTLLVNIGFAYATNQVNAVFSARNAPPAVTNPYRRAGLPTRNGSFRFIPPPGWNPNQPPPRGPKGGYMDKFGLEWVKGPAHHFLGDPYEWDVQLPNGRHIDVSMNGVPAQAPTP